MNMGLTREKYEAYIQILKEELVPAFGCTEPIAIAYCAAKAKEILGSDPTDVVVEASSNIIKNVKSVIVPNTGQLKGISAAAAAGIVVGDASKELEVISYISEEGKERIKGYLDHTRFTVKAMEDGEKLDIRITVSDGKDTAVVRIAKHHTNIVRTEKNGEVLWQSNLVAIHIKTGIGPLSAFCGAVSAGCGIAFLMGERTKVISHTLVNTLAIVSGIICDGANPSCAGKIAVSVDAGILGYMMYKEGQQFYAEDGIVSKGVENTIQNIYRLGAKGMKETDEEIIRIMTHCD